MNVCEALANLYICAPQGDSVLVGTTCLLPSGEVVRLHVRAGKAEAVVTDDGLALSEVEGVGAQIKDANRALARYAKRFGISNSKTELYVRLPIEQLPVGVVLVANAVSEFVREETVKARFEPRRDLRKALTQYIKQNLGQASDGKRRISGKYSQHDFAHVFRFDGQSQIVIVDPVLPEPSSINSRVVAHLDVREEYHDKVRQYLVYDDEDDWTPDRLGVLRLAADIVPFSKIDMAFKNQILTR